MSWPTPPLNALLGIEHPIIQAPMAGASTRVLAGTTTIEGARQLVAAGVDAIIAQGSEAGGRVQRGVL
jgi:NAD(P)H-dependent flavin oxidoreductase YrpB (nitropropane dioxygenase family)